MFYTLIEESLCLETNINNLGNLGINRLNFNIACDRRRDGCALLCVAVPTPTKVGTRTRVRTYEYIVM